MGGRVHETPVEDFEAQLRLNLRPTYLVCQAAIPHLIAAGGGAIVCVSSRAALKPFAGAAGYIVAKAAVLAFVDVLAEEYRDDGDPRQRDPAERHRHARQPPREARRRPRALGDARGDRRRRARSLRGRDGRRQRRARAGLRPRVTRWRGAAARRRGVTTPPPRVQSRQCIALAASSSRLRRGRHPGRRARRRIAAAADEPIAAGVTAAGVDLSGLTVEQASARLEALTDRLEHGSVLVEVADRQVHAQVELGERRLRQGRRPPSARSTRAARRRALSSRCRSP